jgi:aminoglycoside phosphotransferase (APT) family kinase protein
MLSQQTPAEVVERERQLVRKLIGLSDSDHVVLNDRGWTSRVYIVNDGQYVVKFPRGEVVRREYASEIAVLNLLAQIESPVRVPVLRWLHPDNAYLGYEGIVGDEFAPMVALTDAETRRAVGYAVGSFLKQLHGLALEGARVMTIEDEIDEFQSKYDLASPVVTRDFTEDEQARLATLIEEEMPKELLRLGEDRALCHGDLGLWNMILQYDRQVGIIDFGDVGYYDHSKDFMGLGDPDLLEAALVAYGESKYLRRKIAVRQKILYILDLPFFIGKDDGVGIRKTVAKIKAIL